jgi:HTH-type transcriptional regulator, sugar sensing transcriptional regulator
MDRATESAVGKLTAVGLTRLEAEVYAALLANPPMTAYRVAKHLGAANANTYKAIESLSRRGAVLVEEGENRLCRAVPANEFLKQLERTFCEETNAASHALARIQQESFDERVYKLESIAQMLERTREMLETRCTTVAVVDAFPNVLNKILPSINRAIALGRTVYVQAYSPIKIPGAVLVLPDLGERSREFWNSEQLNVAIDGRECLVALVDSTTERIYQGLWSNSLYLSCLMLTGSRSEQTIHRLRGCMNRKDGGRSMRAILKSHSFFLNSDVPGQRELLARFVRKGEGALKASNLKNVRLDK